MSGSDWRTHHTALVRIAQVVAREFPDSDVVNVAKGLGEAELAGAKTAGELLMRLAQATD